MYKITRIRTFTKDILGKTVIIEYCTTNVDAIAIGLSEDGMQVKVVTTDYWLNYSRWYPASMIQQTSIVDAPPRYSFISLW